MLQNKHLPYIMTAAAILGMIFLVIAGFALNSARLNTIIFATQTHVDPSTTSTIPYDDPLITYVPDASRNANQKTKVFVSSQDPIIGSGDANVYVILYGSLLDADMQTYLAGEYGDTVTVVWKDYAVSTADREAAMVGHCANTVGKFWDYAKALNGVASDQTDYAAVAEQVGVNRVELDICLATGGVGAIVDQSTGLAVPLGVTTTHSVFVNDDLYNDAMSVEELKNNADALLATF
ncbi:MAG: thioredoxin domain-containing protein [Candidatus Kerfeldbacteria bacterium]|nr:thioredoxin domain-containing protein [Candidatus Kerfeldbacteria bacterium]